MKAPKILLLAALSGFFTANFSFAQTWTQTSAPNTNWVSIAESSDGTKLVALATHVVIAIGTNIFQGAVYVSTNSGTTWAQVTNIPNNYWMKAASSADGSQFVAVAYGGCIYISTNSGGTWTATGTNNSWSCIASSADGKRLVAGTYSGGVYTNTGMDWVATSAPTSSWYSIASSADGKILVARADGLYISTNFGASWTQYFAGGPDLVASSAGGDKLAEVTDRVYISADLGATWIPIPNPVLGFFDDLHWEKILISADGNKIFAEAFSSGSKLLYVSTDGATWTKLSDLPAVCTLAASSADCGNLVAIGGGIWTSQITPIPAMNITPTNGIITLSWLVPSINFVLQQSADLSSWTDLTNTPVLNLTNLQNEVSLLSSGSNGFYRLKTP